MSCIICGNTHISKKGKFCKKHYHEDLKVRKSQIRQCVNCGVTLSFRVRNATCPRCSHKKICENYRSIESNMEKIRTKNREYKLNNKEKIRKHDIERYHSDVEYKIKRNLRHRLNQAIKNNFKSGSAIKDLGCSISELKMYLEQKFQLGMTWDNYCHKIWQIDHIEPLCAFNLTDRNQLLKACHYTNLEPKWSEDNSKKIAHDIKKSLNKGGQYVLRQNASNS